MKIQALTVLLIVNSLLAQDFDDLVCSGFVEFAQGDFDGLDYSSIEINLFTMDGDKFEIFQGQLVEQSNCASNGFYLLPIHDLKDFYIRVTSKDEILQFKPAQSVLEFSRTTLQEARAFCENNINFRWSGFQLTERVHVYLEDTQELDYSYLGGIELNLHNQQGELLATTLTEVDGQFTFNDIMPGKLIIKPSPNTSLQFYLDNDEMNCEVLWNKGKHCKGQLTLQGFDLKGIIHNENDPLSNFRVMLEPIGGISSDINLPNCVRESNSLCTVISGNDGSFHFAGVPLGRYLIHFRVQGDLEESIIEIEPESIYAQVTSAPLNIYQQLLVNRLTINGRVADSRGVGIEGVKIYLDGQEQTVTDLDGNYVLSKVKTGVYTLEAYHNHMIFEPLNNLKLSLGLKTVPNLQLKYLHICGQINLNTGNSIQLGDDAQFNDLKIVIFFENKNEKSEKRTTSVSKEDQYRYCFEARPGQYLIYPVVVQPEKGKEIVWQPKTREVDLYDQPQLNVNFERKIVILGGTVQFLNNIDKNQVFQTKIKLFSVKEPQKVLQEQNLSSVDVSFATFQFENILHGSYTVSIWNPLLCFKQSAVPLLITAQSASDVQFFHNGYSMNYKVNQLIPVTLTPKHNNHQQQEKVTLQPQLDKMCLPAWDDYIITVDECYQAEPQVYQYKISNPTEKVEIQVRKIKISGQLSMGPQLAQSKSDDELLQQLSQAIQIEITQTLPNGVIETVPTQIEYEASKQHYSFIFYAQQSTHLSFKPQFVVTQGVDNPVDNLLFQPKVRTQKVGSECVESVVRFEINTGFVFHGSFADEIENVQITVLSNGKDIIESFSTSNQKFKLGPYIDNIDYTLSFDKPGFRFQQTITRDKNIVRVDVSVEQLATLKVSIVDEKGASLSAVTVFISTISKTNNVRLTNQTNEAGEFQSSNFVQGEYMVKAYMKEYMFEPSSKMVKLDSGQVEVVQIVGRKVAFSIYGKVQDFNKDGVEGVVVEAYHLNNPANTHPKETSTTDKYGNYRIRGLEPQKKYQLKLKPDSAGGSQVIITPQHIDLHVGKEDMYNKDFIIFQKHMMFLIQGRLLIDSTYTKEEADLQQITSFEVFAEQNPEIPLQSLRKLQFHRYYEVELFEPQDIIIKIVVEKEREKGESQPFVREFKHTVRKQINSTYKYYHQHNFELSKQPISEQKIQKNTSIGMPLFMIILVLVALNFDRVSLFVQSLHKH